MGIYTKKIESIKKSQNQYMILKKKIVIDVNKIDKELNKHIAKRWKENFGDLEVDFITCLQAGCLSNKWFCEVCFYSVGNLEYCNGAFYDFVENKAIYKKTQSSISVAKLKKFTKDMTEETGCKCKWFSSSFVRKQIEENHEN